MSKIFTISDTGVDLSDDSEANPGFAIGMGSPSGSTDIYWHFRGSSFFSSQDAASISIGATDMENQGYVYGNTAYYAYFSAHGDFSSHGAGTNGLIGVKNGDFSGSRYPFGSYVREDCGAKWSHSNGGRASVLSFGRKCLSKAGNFTLNGTTGNQSVTGIGFQPDFILFLGCVAGDENVNAQGANYMVGAVDSDLNQWVGSYRSYFYAGSPTGYSRQSEWYNDACIAHIGKGGYGTPTTHGQHASLVSMDVDGFTINLTVAGFNSSGVPMRVKYLAVKLLGDGRIAVGTGVQGDAAVSCGFDSEVIMFASTQGIAGETHNEAFFNHGAVDAVGTNVNYFEGAQSNVGADRSVQRSMGRTSTDSCIWMTDYDHSGTPPGFDTWVGGDPIAAATASMNGGGADLDWTFDNGDDREFGWIAFRVGSLPCPLAWIVSMYSKLDEDDPVIP